MLLNNLEDNMILIFDRLSDVIGSNETIPKYIQI